MKVHTIETIYTLKTSTDKEELKESARHDAWTKEDGPENRPICWLVCARSSVSTKLLSAHERMEPLRFTLAPSGTLKDPHAEFYDFKVFFLEYKTTELTSKPNEAHTDMLVYGLLRMSPAHAQLHRWEQFDGLRHTTLSTAFVLQHDWREYRINYISRLVPV